MHMIDRYVATYICRVHGRPFRGHISSEIGTPNVGDIHRSFIISLADSGADSVSVRHKCSEPTAQGHRHDVGVEPYRYMPIYYTVTARSPIPPSPVRPAARAGECPSERRTVCTGTVPIRFHHGVCVCVSVEEIETIDRSIVCSFRVWSRPNSHSPNPPNSVHHSNSSNSNSNNSNNNKKPHSESRPTGGVGVGTVLR